MESQVLLWDKPSYACQEVNCSGSEPCCYSYLGLSWQEMLISMTHTEHWWVINNCCRTNEHCQNSPAILAYALLFWIFFSKDIKCYNFPPEILSDVIPSHLLNVYLTWTLWWCMPVILALQRMRQEDCEFKVSLNYTARPCLKNRTKQIKKTTKKCIWQDIPNINDTLP
jgi:hypothetical protein